MTGNRRGGFDLLQKIVLIYIGIIVRILMVVRVNISVIILYLNPCSNSFRTERCFITSGAASDDFRCQVNRVSSDDVAHHFNKIGWLVA